MIVVDSYTPNKRSWVMSRIRSEHTKPELIVRSLLHRCGYRFSLRNHKLPGRPDLVLPKYRTAIFVHGCFWHRHPGCAMATMPKTRTAFWQNKFSRNTERDQDNQKRLKNAGWQVLVIWECEILRDPNQTISQLAHRLDPQKAAARNPCQYLPERRHTLRMAENKMHYRLDKSHPKHPGKDA